MITIIDYDVGNLASVGNALSKLGYEWNISDDPVVLENSRLLILPGVGAAGSGMKNLQRKGLDNVIKQLVARGKPLLGICLGMQLLFDYSEENEIKCLGILRGKVKRFRKEKIVPQIGWNKVKPKIKDSISTYMPTDGYYYFVNSYYCEPKDTSSVVGETVYGEKFASMIANDTIVATQFHPEKSGSTGLQSLQTILEDLI